MTTIAEYKQTIAEKLEEEDVALLFLNAGVGQVGAFCEVPEERI